MQAVTSLLLLLCLLWEGKSSSLPFQQNPKEWPCPNYEDIAPCICAFEADYSLHLDCSNVVSNDQLAQVFTAAFPDPNFKSLTIAPATPNTNLTGLTSGVFGYVTFKHVIIKGTNIGFIEEQALAGSHKALLTLILQNNPISSFPFESLTSYTYLWKLDLQFNQLSIYPNLESESLEVIDLSGNHGHSLGATVFLGTPYLREIYLRDMEIRAMQPDTFLSLNYLGIVDLSDNLINGPLPEDFVDAAPGSLEQLLIRNCSVTNLSPDAISGLDRMATVDLRTNNIERLEEADWLNLFNQLTLVDSLDVRENPLLCSCDIIWLLEDAEQLGKLHRNTTCLDGSLLYDKPLDDILQLC